MKNKIIKLFSIFVLVMILSVAIVFDVLVQCLMCCMFVESNFKNGGIDGKGLNNGILYMLVMFYMFIGVIGFIWWCNCCKEDEEEFGLVGE